MLNTPADVIKTLRIRSIAHKLEYEKFEHIETGLKIPSSILASIGAISTTITAVAIVPYLPFINIGVGLLVAILTATSATLKLSDKIKQHSDTAKIYERLYNKCTSANFKGLDAEAYKKLVDEVEQEATSATMSAPLVSLSNEEKASKLVAAVV